VRARGAPVPCAGTGGEDDGLARILRRVRDRLHPVPRRSAAPTPTGRSPALGTLVGAGTSAKSGRAGTSIVTVPSAVPGRTTTTRTF